MTGQCDASFENEELVRKAEIETARARERIMAEIDEAEDKPCKHIWNLKLGDDSCVHCGLHYKEAVKMGIKVECRHGTEPEPYEFQAFSAYSMLAIQASVGGLFCTNCIHRLPHRPVCAQMHCGTLDRIDNRLWEVER